MTQHLTPVRRALLMAVQRGEVHRYGDAEDYANGWKKCTAAMDVMRRAGWVTLADDTVHPHKLPWELTELGRRVLGQDADDAVWKELS